MLGLEITGPGAMPRLNAGLERPLPAAGQTLVKMAAVALGHLDLSVASGAFPSQPRLPYIPCGDGAGWIAESATFAPGTLAWIRGAGLGVSRNGIASQYAAVPDEAVHPAPSDADPSLAACFFSPATTAWLAVHELGGVTASQRVLVTGGAGAVGSLAVQIAMASGALVTAAVSRPERAALMPSGAACLVTGPGAEPFGAAEFDVLIDTIGGPGLTARLDAVRAGGVAVIIGYTAGTVVSLDLPARCAHDVELRFFNLIRRAPAAFAIADGLLASLSAGELTLRMDAYPLSGAAGAWQALAHGTAAGRVVLEVAR